MLKGNAASIIFLLNTELQVTFQSRYLYGLPAQTEVAFVG